MRDRLRLSGFLFSLVLSTPAFSQGYTFTRLAGAPGGPGFEDGVGANARFATPGGIAADGAGGYYFGDLYGWALRHVDRTAGAVTTAAGTAGLWGMEDGVRFHAQLRGITGLAVGPQGRVYFAEWYRYSSGTIREFDAGTGAVRTVATGISEPKGLVSDGAGYLYVADTYTHQILKVNAATGKVGVFAPIGFGTPGFARPSDVAFDGLRTFYVADAGSSTICAVDLFTAAVSIVAGAVDQTGSDDGPPLAARFSKPEGLAWDVRGWLWVADTGNHTIRRIVMGPSPSVSTVAGLAGFPGGRDGAGSGARFSSPVKLTVDEAGFVAVSDSGNDAIRLLTPATGDVTTLAGATRGDGCIDGQGPVASFANPTSVTADVDGMVYVADSSAHVIRGIDPAGNVTTIAGLAGVPGASDATGAAARFDTPRGVAADGAGNLYVADWRNGTIRKIALSTGAVTTIAGQAGAHGTADGPGNAARFGNPSNLAFDGAGGLWLIDFTPDWDVNLRRVSLPSTNVRTVLRGAFGDECGLVADPSGVYIADKYGAVISRWDNATGAIRRIAGTFLKRGYADGPKAEARFYEPSGVVPDGAGHLLVVDEVPGTLRVVDIADGSVRTIAGLASRWWTSDGTDRDARWVNPVGIATAPDGRLLVVDDIGQALKVGRTALADHAVIDAGVGPAGQTRQLDAAPRTGSTFHWEVVRRPLGSTAQLSSVDVPNPTFTPDLADLFVFRCTATGPAGSSITTVRLGAGESAVVPTAVVSGDRTICPGGNAFIHVAVTGTPPFRVVWSDGFEGLDRQVFPSTTTTWTVTSFSDAFQAGTSTGSATVTVETPPAAPVITAPDRVPANATGLQASVPVHPGASYRWSISGGVITSNEYSSSITFNTFSRGTVTLFVSETSAAGCLSPTASFPVLVLDTIAPLGFYTVEPCRLLDTRVNGFPVGPSSFAMVQSGSCGVPSDARSMVLNVTAVDPSGAGTLTAAPGCCGTPPDTNAVAFGRGQTRAGFGTYVLDPSYGLQIYNRSTGTVHVVVDVTGYYK